MLYCSLFLYNEQYNIIWSWKTWKLEKYGNLEKVPESNEKRRDT